MGRVDGRSFPGWSQSQPVPRPSSVFTPASDADAVSNPPGGSVCSKCHEVKVGCAGLGYSNIHGDGVSGSGSGSVLGQRMAVWSGSKWVPAWWPPSGSTRVVVSASASGFVGRVGNKLGFGSASVMGAEDSLELATRAAASI